MSFGSIAWRLEEYPWQWPLRLGFGVQMLRSRYILSAVDQEGWVHHAELGPCPGVHPETLDQALVIFQERVLPILVHGPLYLHRWRWQEAWFGLLDLPRLATSVQSATEQLLLSWASRQYPQQFSLSASILMRGSALLPMPRAHHHDQSWQEFIQLWQQGFRVFKCKVGRDDPLADIAFLERMLDFAGSELELRLDANQGLSADDIKVWQTEGRGLPIAYWEEADRAEGGKLGPRALDESLWDCDPEKIADDAPVWILKPSRMTLSRTIAFLTVAAARHKTCVMSNAFDSGLSLRCWAWIYAAFCVKPQALGFGTSRFLPEDDWQSLAFAVPVVEVPSQPFGFE